MKWREHSLRALLFFLSMVITLILCELGLRVYAANTIAPIWRPHLKKIFNPNLELMPGVSRQTRFTINSDGIRGDEFAPDQTYHLLAIGGSTTESLYMDDQEAWPYLTQSKLRAAGVPIWIGNVGRSGARLKDHLEDVKKIKRKYPVIDGVIVLVGINDLAGALVGTLETVNQQTIKDSDWYRKIELWKLGSRLKHRLITQKKGYVQDELGSAYALWRTNRKKAEKVDVLPDLSVSKKEYEEKLRELIEFSKASDLRLILMTQPAMFRQDMSEQEKDLLWFGWGGEGKLSSSKYYSALALEKMMKEYNDVLRKVCDEDALECVDLEAMIEKDTSSFFDDCHFNVSGSRKVATALSGFLLGTKSTLKKAA